LYHTFYKLNSIVTLKPLACGDSIEDFSAGVNVPLEDGELGLEFA
jgi:hypothetical protein